MWPPTLGSAPISTSSRSSSTPPTAQVLWQTDAPLFSEARQRDEPIAAAGESQGVHKKVAVALAQSSLDSRMFRERASARPACIMTRSRSYISRSKKSAPADAHGCPTNSRLTADFEAEHSRAITFSRRAHALGQLAPARGCAQARCAFEDDDELLLSKMAARD
jgi:hypothetical protein